MKIFDSSFHSLVIITLPIIFQSISTAQNNDHSLDINFVTLMHEGFSDSNSTFFGYTTSLAQGSSPDDSGWIFIGAPKSNVSMRRLPENTNPYFEPGVIWRCKLGPADQKCEILHFLDQYCKDRVSKSKADYGKCDSNFMGGSLVIEKGILVACAPNWNRERRASPNGLRMDGACYWMRQNVAVSDHLTLELANRTEDPQRGNLIPFQDASFSRPDTALWKEHSVLRWYFAETGFSSHITKSLDIVLGAVGTYYTRGSMLKVQGNEYTNWGLTNLETFDQIKKNSKYFRNFGYAVTSGNYLDQAEILYAASSPGGNSNSGPMSGVILIISAESFLPSKKFQDADKIEYNYKHWKEKYQLAGKFGSYFGAALQSIDINGDGLEELLVGAPLQENSDKKSISGPINEHGCVYIYSALGEKKFIYNEPAQILCGEDPRGRFGTSIASLGDLNQDGFNDLAVGAPYGQSGGTVYIYYGDKNLNLNLRKFTVNAESYKSPLSFSSFGFSITGGVDLDGNGTPDLCIGSYADKNVAIFRTRPKMEIFPALFTYVKHKSENPIILEKDAGNFTLELCVTIRVKSNTKDLPHAINTVIHARIVIDRKQRTERFRFGRETSVNTSFVFPASETRVCQVFPVERKTISDELEGQEDVEVEYFLWYNYTKKKSPEISMFVIQNETDVPKISVTGQRFADFCSNCPYPVKTDLTQVDIPFKKECRRWNENGSLPVCRPNLTLAITGRYGDCGNLINSLNGSVNNLTFGDAPCIEVYVQVKNWNQTAYSPKMKLSWRWDTARMKLPILSGKEDVCIVREGSADCKLDRVKTYLETNRTQTQRFGFKLQQDPVTSKAVRFELNAEVYLESDNSSENVSASLTINHNVNASINLMDGSLSNNTFPIPVPGQLNYQFKTRIAGTTPLSGTIQFLLPVSVNWKGRKINLFTIDTPRILKCNPISVNDLVFKDYGTTLRRGKGTFGSLYDKSHCQAWSCSFYVTRRDRFLDMKFDVKLRDLDFTEKVLLTEGAMDFYGMAHAQILDLPPMANFTRIIINRPELSGLPAWILLAAAGVGLLSLILIIFILRQCGFFKRGVKERLDAKKAEAETELMLNENPSQIDLEGDKKIPDI